MALGTLAEVRSSALAMRPDLVPKFDEYLALAEQMIYVGDGMVEPLRVRAMEHSTSLTVTAGVATIPTDYLGRRGLIWNGVVTVDVGYEPPTTFYQSQRDRASYPVPVAYTVEGSSLKLSSGVTGAATLLYYRRLTTPVADGDTNAIMTGYPSLYLRAVQIEMFRDTRNDTELAKVLDAYAKAVTAANRASSDERYSGGNLKKRVGGGWGV